jgi:hypothetical protein
MRGQSKQSGLCDCLNECGDDPEFGRNGMVLTCQRPETKLKEKVMSQSTLLDRHAKVQRLAHLKNQLDQETIPAFLPGRDLLEKYREAVSLVIEIVADQERGQS